MKTETKQKLLAKATFSKDELIEIIESHTLLYGLGYDFNPIDKVSIQFHVDRVRAYYENDVNAIASHKAFVQYEKDNPQKTPRQLAKQDNLNKKDFDRLALEHNKHFGNSVVWSFETEVVRRLTKKMSLFYAKDENVMHHYKLYQDSLIVQDSWSLLELCSKKDCTPEDNKRLLNKYKELFPKEIIGDLSIERTMRLIRYKLRLLL